MDEVDEEDGRWKKMDEEDGWRWVMMEVENDKVMIDNTTHTSHQHILCKIHAYTWW